MADLTLFSHPMSRGRIARWMLEEIGAPYDLEVVDYGPAMKSADYRAINPMGKVPALRHGSLVVTEAAAICTYLADAFPAAGLAPATTAPERGTYYRWMFFAAGPFEQAVTARAMGWDIAPGRNGMVGFGSYATTMDMLEQAVSRGPFLLGETFSAADVYLGSQVGWGLQFGTVEKRPAFEAYWARLDARPAHRRATEMDDALVPLHPMPEMSKS